MERIGNVLSSMESPDYYLIDMFEEKTLWGSTAIKYK